MKRLCIYLRFLTLLLGAGGLLVGSSLLTGCATTKGAVYGAGIGALAGDAEKGARIGASAGAIVDILD